MQDMSATQRTIAPEPDYEGRFCADFAPVGSMLDTFAAQAAERSGIAIGMSLRFTPSGDDGVRVNVVLAMPAKAIAAATIVWAGKLIYLTHRGRCLRLKAHERGAFAKQFNAVLADALVLGLDSLRGPQS